MKFWNCWALAISRAAAAPIDVDLLWQRKGAVMWWIAILYTIIVLWWLKGILQPLYVNTTTIVEVHGIAVQIGWVESFYSCCHKMLNMMIWRWHTALIFVMDCITKIVPSFLSRTLSVELLCVHKFCIFPGQSNWNTSQSGELEHQFIKSDYHPAFQASLCHFTDSLILLSDLFIESFMFALLLEWLITQQVLVVQGESKIR